MTAFRQLHILHVSDPHFGENHICRPPDPTGVSIGIPSLKELLRQDLNREDWRKPVSAVQSTDLEPTLALVAVTGDLTQTADPEEFDEAYEFLAGLAGAPLLGFTVGLRNLFVVPGNHDVVFHRSSPEHRFARYCQFYNKLFETVQPDQRPYARPEKANSLSQIHAFPESQFLIAEINSCLYVEKETIEASRGHVDHETIASLRRQLDNYGEDAKAWIKVALVHHHPVLLPELIEAGRGVDSILNAPSLVRLLRENGFQLVLHGHKHFPLIFPYDQDSPWATGQESAKRLFPPLIVAGGSCASKDLPEGTRKCNTYNLITVKWNPVLLQASIQVVTRGLTRTGSDRELDPDQWHWETLYDRERTVSPYERSEVPKGVEDILLSETQKATVESAGEVCLRLITLNWVYACCDTHSGPLDTAVGQNNILSTFLERCALSPSTGNSESSPPRVVQGEIRKQVDACLTNAQLPKRAMDPIREYLTVLLVQASLESILAPFRGLFVEQPGLLLDRPSAVRDWRALTLLVRLRLEKQRRLLRSTGIHWLESFEKRFLSSATNSSHMREQVDKPEARQRRMIDFAEREAAFKVVCEGRTIPLPFTKQFLPTDWPMSRYQSHHLKAARRLPITFPYRAVCRDTNDWFKPSEAKASSLDRPISKLVQDLAREGSILINGEELAGIRCIDREDNRSFIFEFQRLRYFDYLAANVVNDSQENIKEEEPSVIWNHPRGVFFGLSALVVTADDYVVLQVRDGAPAFDRWTLNTSISGAMDFSDLEEEAPLEHGLFREGKAEIESTFSNGARSHSNLTFLGWLRNLHRNFLPECAWLIELNRLTSDDWIKERHETPIRSKEAFELSDETRTTEDRTPSLLFIQRRELLQHCAELLEPSSLSFGWLTGLSEAELKTSLDFDPTFSVIRGNAIANLAQRQPAPPLLVTLALYVQMLSTEKG